MQAGEESRKNKQLLLISWHRANTGDSKCLLIKRPHWLQSDQLTEVLIFGPFKQSSDDDTNIISLEDLLAIFQYCKGSLTRTRDTASDSQKKAFYIAQSDCKSDRPMTRMLGQEKTQFTIFTLIVALVRGKKASEAQGYMRELLPTTCTQS